MSKRGRPRKTGRRYRCGKRTPATLEDDVMQTAVEARMRVFDVSKELAKSNAMGSPLQRLQHWRHITTAQADAGYSFAVTMREYLATAKLHRPTVGSASLEAKSPSNDSETSVRGETKARAYMDALAEIDRLDSFVGLGGAPTATSVVWDVCINEVDRHSEREIGALRVGLNAIHRVLYGRKAA